MIKTFAAVSAAALALVAMPAAAQDWSGFYVGGFAGYQTNSEQDNETLLFDINRDGTFGDTVRTTTPVTGPDAFSPGFCSGTPNGNNAGAGCSDDEDGSGEFGLRAGYDFQSGAFVFGVVAEASTSSVEDNVTGFSVTPANYRIQREFQSMYAARVRLGYAYGRYLPYVTGGYASARVENNFSTSNTANAFSRVNDETDATGYQIGGGLETMVTDRLSLGVEYIYSDLEDDDAFVTRVSQGTAAANNPFVLSTTGVATAGTDLRRSGDSSELHSFRVTAAVRF